MRKILLDFTHYPHRAPLAFSKAIHPQFALDISLLTDLVASSNKIIEAWELRTRIFLAEGSHLEDNLPPRGNFIWTSVASACVSALLETLVDTPSARRSRQVWVEKTLGKIDSQIFTHRTGVSPSGHQAFLTICSHAFFTIPSSVDLIYRDRLVRLEWDKSHVSATHLDVLAMISSSKS